MVDVSLSAASRIARDTASKPGEDPGDRRGDPGDREHAIESRLRQAGERLSGSAAIGDPRVQRAAWDVHRAVHDVEALHRAGDADAVTVRLRALETRLLKTWAALIDDHQAAVADVAVAATAVKDAIAGAP